MPLTLQRWKSRIRSTLALGLLLVISATLSAQSGNALRFDGADDLVTGPSGGQLNLTGTYTLEAWVRPDSIGGYQTILARGQGNAAGDYAFQIWSDGRIALKVGVLPRVFSQAAIQPGLWSHVAFEWHTWPGLIGSAHTFYLNGIPESSRPGSMSGGSTSSSDPLQLGRQGSSSNVFRGMLDEVRIWNTHRSPAQIKAGLTGLSNPTGEANLVAYYQFEGTGQTVTDSSAMGLHGTLGTKASVEPVDPERRSVFIPPSGRLLRFDGVDDRVTVASGGPLNLMDSYTLEAWIRPDSIGGDQTILARGKGGSGYENYQWKILSDGRLELRQGVRIAYSLSALVPGVWSHVAVVRAPGSFAFFLNGRADGAGAHSSTGNSGSMDRLLLGSQEVTGSFFRGMLDEVRIWNVARTYLQIRAGAEGIRNPAGEPSLVAYYQCEGTGQILTDASAKGLHGLLGADDTLQKTDPERRATLALPSSQAIYFDGVDDRVTGPSGGPLNLTDSYTLEAWVRPEAGGGYRTILARGTGGGGVQDYLFLLWPDGRLALSHGGSPWVLSNTAVSAGVWSHVAVVKTPGKFEFYLNGTVDGGGAHSGPALSPSSARLQLGKQGNTANFFRGMLDELRIWNVARTLKQIRAGTDGIPNPAGEAKLVVYYKCNVLGQAVVDSSANGLHAYLGTSASPEATDPLKKRNVNATCRSRNGLGINPEGYHCLTAPVLGSNWLTRIDPGPNTLQTALVLGLGGPAFTGTPFFGGQLLIVPSPAPVVLVGNGSYQIPIPASVAGIGTGLSTQGLRIDLVGGATTIVPLNAIDIHFGF